MSGAYTVDLSNYAKAVRQYAADIHRDLPTAINKTAGNLAARAAQFSPRSSPGAIRSLQSAIWWANFVNKVLAIQGFTMTRRRKATAAEAAQPYMDKVNRQWKTGRKTVGQTRMIKGTLGKEVSPADWLRVSERIIRRRIARIKSFVAVFAYVAQSFGARMDRIGRKVTPGAMKVQKANPSRFEAAFEIPWKSNKTPWPASRGRSRPTAQQDVQAKAMIGAAALRQAERFVIADMRSHVEAVVAKRARQASARAA